MGTAYNNQWVLKRIVRDGNFGQGTLVEQATRKIKALRLDRYGAATIPPRATLKPRAKQEMKTDPLRHASKE